MDDTSIRDQTSQKHGGGFHEYERIQAARCKNEFGGGVTGAGLPPLWRQGTPFNTPRPSLPSPIDHELGGATLGQAAPALHRSPMRPPRTRPEQGVAQEMWHLVAIAHVLAALEVPTRSPPADPPRRKPGTLPRERLCLDG